MRKKMACLITGVPRGGMQRCISSLKFLLTDFDVQYFAVLREEFLTEAIEQEVKQSLDNVEFVIIPQNESQSAVNQFQHLGIVVGVVQMWHEVYFASQKITNLDDYDLVFRTRFDIYFAQQYLPFCNALNDEVWLPSQMSWSGSNDMLCLALPMAFSYYAKTFLFLRSSLKIGLCTPESFIAYSIATQDLSERSLEVRFILYRDFLCDNLSEKHLNALAYLRPLSSTYKVGSAIDTLASRQGLIEYVQNLTEKYAQFPTCERGVELGCFGGPEIDLRDKTVFRWMGMHGALWRALPLERFFLQFTIYFYVNQWSISNLIMLVDGKPISLRVCGEDEFGRKIIKSDTLYKFKLVSPLSKITFHSNMLKCPHKENPASKDERYLSVAIGNFEVVPLNNE